MAQVLAPARFVQCSRFSIEDVSSESAGPTGMGASRTEIDISDGDSGGQQNVSNKKICTLCRAIVCCSVCCCCIIVLGAGGVLWWYLQEAADEITDPGGEAAGSTIVSITRLVNKTVCDTTDGPVPASESTPAQCNSTKVVVVEVIKEVQCPFLGTGPDECPRGNLSIRVTGINGDGGIIRVLLFASDGAWRSDSRYRGAQAETTVTAQAAPGTMVASFDWALHADYAAMAHHDEDGDGKLDTIFGYPREGLAASEGASGGPFGGPKWRDAKFAHGGALTAKKLPMWYP